MRLYRYRERSSGELFTANDRPSKLPPDAVAVFGLDDSVRAAPLGGSEVSASQLHTAYNAQRLISAGTDGTGQTVAIFAKDSFSSSNIDSFSGREGLPFPKIAVSFPAGQSSSGVPYGWVTDENPTPSFGSDRSEADIDIEAVHAMAPGAAIHVYEASAADYPSWIVGLASFIQGVSNDGEHIASISYGSCESQISRRDLSVLASWFSELAVVKRVAVFAASGDTGKECPAFSGMAPNGFVDSSGVDYPASDPSVTGVGGTHLDLTSADTLNAEQAWDDVSEKPKFASGGGTSGFFARPVWQRGAGLPAGGTNRMVPDVAIDSDSNNGLTVTIYDPSHAQCPFYCEETVGGTSVAASLWAGVAAIYDQDAAAHGAPFLGVANAVLYSLAGRSDRPLFDVSTAQNGGGDLAGPVGVGWDAATGLGSPNVDTLVRDGVAQTAPPPADVNVQQVNWANVTVPADACGTSGPVQLKDGRATAASNRFPGFPTVTVSVPVPISVGGGISYGDLEKSGHDDAALLVTCDTGGGTGASTLADSLVVYTGTAGLHALGVLHTVTPSTYGATAFSQPSIQLATDAVRAVESAYAAGDVAASPSQSRNDSWSWDGHNFHLLTNPAPAPTSTTTTSNGEPSNFTPGSPEWVANTLYTAEQQGDWNHVCSLLQPSAQNTCMSVEAGNTVKATGNFIVQNAVVQGNEALVSIIGTLTIPSEATYTNNDPQTGMPPGTPFQKEFDTLTGNNSPTVLSPFPCIQIGGKWYADLSM